MIASPCFPWGRRIKGEKWRHKDRALGGASNDSQYEPCCMILNVKVTFLFRSFSASLAFGIKHSNYSNFLCWSRQTVANLGHVNRTQGPLSRTNPTSDSKSPRLCYNRSQVCTLNWERASDFDCHHMLMLSVSVSCQSDCHLRVFILDGSIKNYQALDFYNIFRDVFV